MNCQLCQRDPLSIRLQKPIQGLEIEATALTLFVYSV
jgi:hypothetical protein